MKPPIDIASIPNAKPAYFAPQQIHGMYAARNGLFLIDSERLHARLGPDIPGSRLLETFIPSGRGAALCQDGLLVPAFGVEAGFYSVLVRSTETEDAFTPLTHLVYSAGFVLGTATGALAICNTDRLSHNPQQRSDRPAAVEHSIQVSPGWYSVTVVAGIEETAAENASHGDTPREGWVCCFLLDPQSAQPQFTADLSTTLSFFAG